MVLNDIDEATAILDRMLAGVTATLSGNADRPSAALRYAVGDLQANAGILMQAATFATPLLNCFTLALQAGATLLGMDAVRLAMLAETPSSLTAIAVTNLGIRFALCQEARILAATTFVSRDDVDAAIAMANGAFDAAEEYAADNSDPATYQALLALHSAVTRDLAVRAKPLPRMVEYAFPRSFPSLALANRLYADAGRADELRMENHVIHPAFMPATGRALSS